MEGISGISRFAQCGRDPELYEKEGRPLLMKDIWALVDGLLEGGATDIVINDGHGGGGNFVPDMMHPGARYFTGIQRPCPAAGIDDSFDAAVLLGYHAMNGTPTGMMHHTQSSLAETKYWYAGVESGEIVQSAIVIGSFGVPIVMVTGDVATGIEAKRFLGDDIVHVAVKEGYGRQCGLLYAPEKAHEMIREGAVEALKRIPLCKPYTVEFPLEGKMVVQNLEYAAKRGTNLSTKVGPNTWIANFESALDIYNF